MGVPQIYPVPPSAEKAGDTDRFISTWLKHQKRENLVVATKVRCSIAIIQGGKNPCASTLLVFRILVMTMSFPVA